MFSCRTIRMNSIGLCLTDEKYRTEYFLNRVFGKEILNKNFFRIFALNPVTEKQLCVKLREISVMEGTRMDSAVLEGIAQASNKEAQENDQRRYRARSQCICKGQCTRDFPWRRQVPLQ